MTLIARKIVCAAVRNKRTAVIIAGVRHFDLIMRPHLIADPDRDAGYIEGFLDASGKFYERTASLQIAVGLGQVDPENKIGNPGELYSEDLY